MLLIILLGVIAKLAPVSADCDIEPATFKIKDWSNLTGTWYWLYHIPQKYNERLDCPISTFEPITNNLGKVTTSVYIKKTGTRHNFTASTTLWDDKENPDVHYAEPRSDANCAANGTCIRNPGYTSAWSGKYRPVAVDYKRYSIFEYCCKKLNTICFYVAFRSPNPDEETLNDVKKALKENDLDFNRLVKFETNHC